MPRQKVLAAARSILLADVKLKASLVSLKAKKGS